MWFYVLCRGNQGYSRYTASKKRYQPSLYVAAAAKMLAEHYNYKFPEKAYITGLLHDICKE
ncbi:MAG: HDOD domain-containing protein, partial [Oscillospiraceae bacterium]|nr:HDOD domain-containing protein [Oscillospiraceae bacterium]